MILGIDEVGRGPWAGPLVMGAVILGDAAIEGLTDSKKLSKKRRDLLDVEIREKARAFGLGWVSAEEIDKIGLAASLPLACRRAVEAADKFKISYGEIIIDGTINFLKDTNKGPYVSTLKKADLLIQAVSAASIIAKVARDNYMIEQAALYPEYGFDGHVGYGTAAHIAAIEKYGVTPLHRLSFAPLRKYRLPQEGPDSEEKASLTTRQIGDVSESVAASELVRRGHRIIARNWKNKYCEIDIISTRDEIFYFTEVKHRKNDKAGDGLAAITPKKLTQMKFAAKIYAHSTNTDWNDMRLIAVATTGDPPKISELVVLD